MGPYKTLSAASLSALGGQAVCGLLEKPTLLLYGMMMTLDKKSAREARKRALAYEANLAVEGIALHTQDKAFTEQLDAEAVGYAEGVERAITHLKACGVVPVGKNDPSTTK